MKLTNLLGQRYKEKPSEAVIESHSLLLRGGYIRQVANGIYSLLPLGLKVIKKIEQIVREEMDRIDGQEVLLPVALPRELWDESGRYESVGSELLRFKDRTGHEMLLAMTHEEAVVHLARNEINSYKAFPFMVYQIQTKFRDEPRSRGGLIRVREFTMKDGYSFHTSDEDLQTYYKKCEDAYARIFSRVGIPEVAEVESDTGMMGGKVAHEYMLLTECGEDTIVTCKGCDYIANLEVAESNRKYKKEEPAELEKVHTPDRKTIEQVAGFLKVSPKRTAKAVFYEADENATPVLAMIRGDLGVNEAKLMKIIKAPAIEASEETIKKTGSVPGFASGMNLTNCRIIVDTSVKESSNLVGGANEVDYHFMNFNVDRDVEIFELADISSVKVGDPCSSCGAKLTFSRGIEVGNIFQLGTKYTESMSMRYLDKEGVEQTPVMGCYGIGIGRLMSSIAEVRRDKYGPIWPASVAPYSVHMIAINLDDEMMNGFSEPAYRKLLAEGIETVYDNRDERPGVQFADADLIGAPLRLIFSAKNIDTKKVEWKLRDNSEKGFIEYDDVSGFVADMLEKLSPQNGIRHRV